MKSNITLEYINYFTEQIKYGIIKFPINRIADKLQHNS